MSKTNSNPYKLAYIIGLLLNVLSFSLYLFTRNHHERSDIFSESFFISYAIAVIYLIGLGIYKRQLENPRPTIFYGCWINVVLLFTISAFSLNQEMSVFATFPNWLNMYTLVMVALFLVFPYINNLPKFIQVIIYVLTGSALLLSLYMIAYLIVLVPISAIACFFFGISLHTFVPIIWLWLIINFLLKKSDAPKLKHLIWVGFLIPIVVLGFYLNKWHGIQTQVKDVLAEKNLQLQNQLPNAIQLAQKLPADAMTDEILISPIKAQRFWDDAFGFNNMGENKFHDPLSIIAIALFGEIDIDIETVETLLNIRKDHRHQTTRRLWTGMSLRTSSVSNNIRVFPEYRLAYHEKTFVIHNDPNKENRDIWFMSNTQEAVYTFHVPEGSIVTSLSLWINGKEQKSRLTTTQRADSAYTKIVGVERRDPALVHWKEGNTITVTVFPCTEEEDRMFKIGFTTPLSFNNGNLWLENIWFEGPDFNGAREATSIFIEGKEGGFVKMDDEFKLNAKGEYTYKGNYLPDWKIALAPTPLSKNTFWFNGYEYSLQQTITQQKHIDIKEVYLDITKEWTKEEYVNIISELKEKHIYTWLPEKVEITKENKELVWDVVTRNQFSLPFLYNIDDNEHSVIITKSGETSPILADLKESDYADKTINHLLKSTHKTLVLNIGTDLSPLWRSLNELRLIEYKIGSVNDALNTITKGTLNYVAEDSCIVSLHESNMSIVKRKVDIQPTSKQAPDHLLRLFAYNDILRKIGKHYFEKEKYENELFTEAEEGYVVTPISSMIVLESEADYERMGILKNKNTVGNAGILTGGAVPEPHEWLLIIIVFLFIITHLYNKYKNKSKLGATQ